MVSKMFQTLPASNACLGMDTGEAIDDRSLPRARARSLLAQVDSLPSHKLTPFARARLLKLLRAEIRFLDRIFCSRIALSTFNCTNLGYFEAVVRVLHNPAVSAASAVFQSILLSSETTEPMNSYGKANAVHVHIVCTFEAKPVWIIISDRNPKYLNWSGDCERSKGWRKRVEALVNAATQVPDILRPAAILFCFSRGIYPGFKRCFQAEFDTSSIELLGKQESDRLYTVFESVSVGDCQVEACSDLEDEDWVFVGVQKGQCSAIHTLQQKASVEAQESSSNTLLINFDKAQDLLKFPQPMIELSDSECNEKCMQGSKSAGRTSGFEFVLREPTGSFALFLSTLKSDVNSTLEGDFMPLKMINLDTTALIALVSEASNGAASIIAMMSTEDLVSSFGSTNQFMRDQAKEELKTPLLEVMTSIMHDKQPFICETVCHEFNSVVAVCGGSEEKLRADDLLQLLLVVSDTPSKRVLSLPETGKIKEKNKIIFGTGDHWHTPTLTANLSFVRAVQQTGMALSIIEHQPRALVGENCK